MDIAEIIAFCGRSRTVIGAARREASPRSAWGRGIVQDSRVIWVAEIIHRGGMIKKKLADRSARRRNRRTRLRYGYSSDPKKRTEK